MSIKLKLVILYITLVFIVMIISGTIIIVRIRDNEVDSWVKQLRLATNITEEFVMNENPADFKTKLNRIYTGDSSDENDDISNEGVFNDISRDIYIFILSDFGTVIESTAGQYEEEVNMKTITLVMSGQKEHSSYGSGTKTVLSDGSTRYWIDNARLVKGINDKKYIIYTRVDYKLKVLDRLSDVSDTIVIASITALLLTAVIGFLFANTLTAPIVRLTKKSKELAEGNLYQEIETKSKDEIGQLTTTFNYMSKQLRHTFSNIQSEKNKLEILLHNMTDGVLAFDIDGNLIQANSLSQEYLGVSDIYLVTFGEIMEILEVDITGIENIGDETTKEYTSEIGERYINSIFSIYKSDYEKVDGIIIVLQDFTKYKKLDNMRKEFVANVSHEIRTPLTTIKGYTETLLDGALEDIDIAEDFLKVIDSEADRMTLLVRDLLELSRFDNQQLKIEVTETDLISMIRETIVQNKMSAEKKEQTLTFETNLSEAYIKADRGRIIQVLTNIISNAIKYSPQKSKIEINAKENKNEFIVTVKDNGIGIPKEDLGRVFERFYRVDKARSRAMGGTGLGLAIAKEIMEAHEGRIIMESESSEGTTVTLKFNKNFTGESLEDTAKQL